MSQINLTEEELQVLNDCLNNRVEPPEELLFKLFPGVAARIQQLGMFDYKELSKSKHPVLEYAGKRPEAVILEQVNGGNSAGQLRIIKSFANGKLEDWKNLIVRGDNLQFLKTCYLNQDPLIKDKVKGKVKLVYIDPPFGTGNVYGHRGSNSYFDRLRGPELIELLREGLIFLRELLANDGVIFVKVDYHWCHYFKVVMDEIFKNNFRNEIITKRVKKNVEKLHKQWVLPAAHDVMYVYSKTDDFAYLAAKKYLEGIKNGYWQGMDKKGQGKDKIIFGKKLSPPKGRHFKYSQENIDLMIKEKRIRLKCRNCRYAHYEGVWNGCPKCGADGPRVEYWVEEKDYQSLDTNWTDIPGYSFQYGYPTENSEKVLERVIMSSTNEGDLVLDCFAGSGTTAAVAEKLGRRWIVCDFGKHAIYTMQKRLLNIADSKKLGNGGKNEKYGQPPKPFCVVSAGAYDFSKIADLGQNKDAYISFVLSLYKITRDNTVNYSQKYGIANIYAEKDGHPVEIYPVWDDEYLKNIRIDVEYLRNIIKSSEGKLRGDYYIIVPEPCAIIGNTILKNDNNENVNFRLLKFPYKVLEDISRYFQIKGKPVTQKDINHLISSASFYFNEEVKVSAERVEGGFKIIRFHTNILDADKQPFQGLDGLAMILIDFDYDGKIFDIDASVNREQITEDNIIKINGLTNNSHIIAVDRHGNESEITKIE